MLINDPKNLTRKSMVTDKRYSNTQAIAKEGFEVAMSKYIKKIDFIDTILRFTCNIDPGNILVSPEEQVALDQEVKRHR